MIPKNGENILFESHSERGFWGNWKNGTAWKGEAEIGLGEALFTAPDAQQMRQNAGQYFFGSLYVTNQRLIYEGIEDKSKNCIINLEDTAGFEHKPPGSIASGVLYVLMDSGKRHEFLVPDPKPILVHLEAGRHNCSMERAKHCEEHLDYQGAIKLWEKVGKPKEAARVRKLMNEQGAVKVEQTVVHGDYVDDRDTIVKDSVVNKSNIGAGSSKMQELKDLTEMKKEGLIDDDEFKQMKKEILGE